MATDNKLIPQHKALAMGLNPDTGGGKQKDSKPKKLDKSKKQTRT